MSEKDERLRVALKSFNKADFPCIAATVKAVNQVERTCDVQPLDGGAEIFDVRLRAAVDEDNGGLVLIPAVGSTVLVATVNSNWNSAYLAMVSEVDLITLKTVRESLKAWNKDLLAAIRRQVFTTNSGATIRLVNDLEFQQLDTRLDNLFLD